MICVVAGYVEERGEKYLRRRFASCILKRTPGNYFLKEHTIFHFLTGRDKGAHSRWVSPRCQSPRLIINNSLEETHLVGPPAATPAINHR
jgi:hypothetical protein